MNTPRLERTGQYHQDHAVYRCGPYVIRYSCRANQWCVLPGNLLGSRPDAAPVHRAATLHLIRQWFHQQAVLQAKQSCYR